MAFKVCPSCKGKVLCFDSRARHDKFKYWVRRRYECEKCHSRFSTCESIIETGKYTNSKKETLKQDIANMVASAIKVRKIKIR